jgi:segregation and condensation protein A|tara:strand:+ start:16574 stop:17305 length:732 start_codon:yes stop_codon:yes gene_type:complete
LSYEIKIPLFKGPFDLLLFFIERDEIDIVDIPISKITKDFLDYISTLEKMNIEVASEFIVVAATLMRIKSKMLIPRLSIDEDGNEIDPREELVEHLLEYKKYKSVIEDFSSLEEYRLSQKNRGNLMNEVNKISERASVETELQDLDLYKLLIVFQNAIEKFEKQKNKPKHEIEKYPYTIVEQKKFIINELKSKEKISFTKLIDDNPLKILVIYNFLAILELIQQLRIKISIGSGLNNFWLVKR